MKMLAGAAAKLSQDDIRDLEQNGSLSVDIGEANFELLLEDVELSSDSVPGLKVASEKGLTVALDVTITPELEKEGIARELVNRVQNFRKESGLDVTDKITLIIESNDKINQAILTYKDYICTEVLAKELDLKSASGTAFETDIEGELLKIEIVKS